MVEFNPGTSSAFFTAPPPQPVGGRNINPSISATSFTPANAAGAGAGSTAAILNVFQEDLALDDIKKLTPEQLKQMGVKGVIFDLDDTLMPIGTGEFPPDAIQTLKNLQQSGIKVGIISNNPSSDYTNNAKAKLAEQGLDIPFIKSATKPASDDFLAMADRLGLPPDQIAMVGDSRISDMIGGKLAGMKTVHAEWYNADGWRKARGVIGDIGSSIASFFRELFLPDKPAQFVEVPAGA
jgi:uncharacterized protein